MKSFKDISWNVDESEYRNDKALSYSILAKYDRSGFNGLNTLFDKVSSPYLTFGSIVDCIMTDGEEEFNRKYYVVDIPELEVKEVTICRQIFDDSIHSLLEIPQQRILDAIILNEYHSNWQEKTRIKVFIEHCAEYYTCMHLANNREVITTKLYKDAMACVNALKTAPATESIFASCVFDDSIEKLYQLKFKTELGCVDYRCMADLIIVDHDKKVVYPFDLKTSSHYEWDFYKSFVEWSYHIQARLYWRIIRKVMDQDPVFKEYKLDDYVFIVVNRNTLCPLTWKFNETQAVGDIVIGNNKFRDPEKIGKELYRYLVNPQIVPEGISMNRYNNLEEWLNTM